jgi:hypothetical protein
MAVTARRSDPATGLIRERSRRVAVTRSHLRESPAGEGDRPGPLRLARRPAAPGDREAVRPGREVLVRVRVRAASVHPDAWHMVSGRPYVRRVMGAGLRRPKNRVPRTDMAAVVESVGRNVTRFRPGDEMFGESPEGLLVAQRRGLRRVRGHAEDALAPQARRSHVRVGRLPAHIGLQRRREPPQRQATARPEGPGERRGRRRVLRRRADRQGARRPPTPEWTARRSWTSRRRARRTRSRPSSSSSRPGGSPQSSTGRSR